MPSSNRLTFTGQDLGDYTGSYNSTGPSMVLHIEQRNGPAMRSVTGQQGCRQDAVSAAISLPARTKAPAQ